VAVSKFAQWAAVPAVIGVGVGVGGLAAGKGTEAGLLRFYWLIQFRQLKIEPF
jgi:hypothetical protein